MSRGHVLKNSDGGEFRSVLSGSAVLCGRFQYFIVVYWFVQEKKSKPTTKKIANKQNQPNKQEKTLTNFFLPRCHFLFMFCRRLIFGRIVSAACFRCCLAEIKILLSRRLWVYKCSLSMQIMSGKTWFFWAFLLIDNHTTYAGCVMPNDGCLGMTGVMSVKVLLGMHKPFKYTL